MAPRQESNLTTSDDIGPKRVKTRCEHMEQHKKKCERIIHYLRHGKHEEGLSKNEQRTVRSQAKVLWCMLWLNKFKVDLSVSKLLHTPLLQY